MKKFHLLPYYFFSIGWKKLLLIMKITFLLLFLGLCQVNASVYSQNTRFDLDLKNTSIREVFREIEMKSQFHFFYGDNLLLLEKLVHVNAENTTVDKILDKLLAGSEYSYKILESNLIVIAPRNFVSRQEPEKLIGTVTDGSNGEPIVGANIVIEGTTMGAISDINGKFALDIPKPDAILVVSFIGYNKNRIPVKGQTVFDIKLYADVKNLDEVVVVGYGTIRKSDLTGSVAKVSTDKAAEHAYTSVEQMIQGRASGVQITQNTGALGSGMTFSIRGANSVSGSNQPLIVIDGYPFESGSTTAKTGADGTYAGDVPGNNALASLNPNDIESIEILKDASSTAIYGSRGANGVVIITTKRGKEGQERIDYNFRSDFSNLPRKINVLSTQEYIAYSNEAYMDKNNGTLAYLPNDVARYQGINTNWQDEIYQQGFSQDHQVNVSGGDKKLKYSLALGYLTQEGIVKNTSFDRGSVRLNLDRTINKRLSFGMNVNAVMSKNKQVQQSGVAGEIGSSVINAALRTAPLYQAFNEDQQVMIDNAYTNPLTMIQLADDQNRVTQIRTSLVANYQVIDGMQLSIRAGADNTASLRQYYMPRGTYIGNQRNGYAYEGNNKNFNYLAEYTLSYIKTLGKHSINSVGGYTWQQWNARTGGITAGGFPNDNLKYYSLGAATSIDKPSNSTMEWGLASVLGRVNYSYDKRYMLTVTGRYDGSTRLSEGSKWALFPSFALGWNVHNEHFMESVNFISELKLRASYGVSGNQSIGVGSTMANYFPLTAVYNQALTMAYAQERMSNSLLGWEYTKQYNTGMDLSLLEGRYKIGFEYYYKLTSDLLINLPIPATTGYSSYASNAGQVENKGLEFDLSARIFNGPFKWSTSGNISFNRNKIVKFDGRMKSFNAPAIGQINNQPAHIAKVDYPIGSFYGYKIIGIYQTQDEVDKHAVDPSSPKPGDFKYEDISGPNGIPDGLISAFDQEIIGNPYPDYIFGITNDFDWKGFSLNVFVQGSIGQDVINVGRYWMDGLSRSTGGNVRREAFENRWTGPGTSNTYPAAKSLNLPFQGRFTNFIVEDASFVRLKSVTLSYTFPGNSIKYIKNLKVFCTGSNLLTVTKYKGYDPEISARGENALTPGVDIGSIPQYRTISTGINIGF